MRQRWRKRAWAAWLAANDGELGELQEVFFDDQVWFVRYLVVSMSGGLVGREVLITPQSIRSVDDDGRRIVVGLNREQVEDSPPVSSERPVSRHYEAQYHRYYGLDPYWVMAPFGPPPVPKPMPLPGDVPLAPEHPHLRSSDEVRGHHIATRDGDIGKVEDFIIDDSDWSIAYVAIDTRRWLPGRTVLISPAWIGGVDWPGQAIMVDVKRDAIKHAPDYDSSTVITREYEARLFAHYGKSLPARTKSVSTDRSHA